MQHQGSGEGGNVLVCFAVKEEAAAFRKLTCARPEIQVLLTGIGKENAARSICPALESVRPRQVISAGFAGALHPQLPFGTVVFSTDIPELAWKLEEAGARRAEFLCADRIAVTGVEKQRLREATGADAIEMESEAIQKLCHERGIPGATVRIILDEANEDLPLDFNRCMTGGSEFSLFKLLILLAGKPAAIPGLLRLQRQSALASRRLANSLLRILDGRD